MSNEPEVTVEGDSNVKVASTPAELAIPEGYITAQAAATEFAVEGLGAKDYRRAGRQGHIASQKIGSRVVFSHEAVVEFLANRRKLLTEKATAKSQETVPATAEGVTVEA